MLIEVVTYAVKICDQDFEHLSTKDHKNRHHCVTPQSERVATTRDRRNLTARRSKGSPDEHLSDRTDR